MSVSVTAMYELVRTAARMLGDEFDIEIFDFHPWDKLDSPSGTALELGEYAALEGLNRHLNLELIVRYRRTSLTQS